MIDATDVFHTFLSDCQTELARNQEWRDGLCELRKESNYGRWLLWPAPPGGTMPEISIEVRVESRPDSFYILVEGATIAVAKDGTPVDDKSYQVVVNRVARQALVMLSSA